MTTLIQRPRGPVSNPLGLCDCVTIRFPLSGTKTALETVCMEQDVTLGKRILIIDDDDSAREAIKLLLSIDRHCVTEARDGAEALALVAEQAFDLVVLDFFMPGMHGGEVARRIKQMAPSLPILMVTAYREKLIGFDRQGNTNAILGKPFGVSVLRGEIAKLLPPGGESEHTRN